MTRYDLLKHIRDYGELIEAIMREFKVSREKAHEIAAREFGRPKQEHDAER